jgi:hypothetical protein
MIDHQALSLALGVEGDYHDHMNGRAADRGGVVLQETVLPARPGVVKVLKLIYLARDHHGLTNGCGTFDGAVPRRALPGDILGQVVQPCRVVRLPQIRRCHSAPPTNPAAKYQIARVHLMC